MSLAILNVLSDGPMLHGEFISRGLNKTYVDIHLDLLKKQRKVKVDKQGRYCLPTPPPANEPMEACKVRWKPEPRPIPNTTHLTCRVCGESKELARFTRDQYPHPKHPKHLPRCSVCKYRATSEAIRVKAMGLARW
jgi:DNA-binding transcriptional ArsR family regulator